MPEKILVALGGNALVKAGQAGTVAEQAANLRTSLAGVVELIRQGHRVVITHGNGPQVGHILVRAEEARGKAYDLPLDVCVAQSQGETGYLIQQGLEGLLHRNGIDRPVAVLVTRTVVSRDDPRMKTPSKPVGPFYTKDQGVRLSEQGFHLVEDAHRGYRRVVPSPVPLRIVEADIIRRFFEEGVVVIDIGINHVRKSSIEGFGGRRALESKRADYVLVGDVHPSVYPRASLYTPVPGGVGPITVAMVIFQTAIRNGKFQGMMPTHTPMGSRRT